MTLRTTEMSIMGSDFWDPFVNSIIDWIGEPPEAPEVDPLDEILEAAGIGKEAGLPKNRIYIERTMDFDEAQKRSREKLAKLLTDKEWTERDLQLHADPDFEF